MQCYGIDFTNTTYVCNGNGNCTAANNCTCKDGFSGTRCQTIRQCSNIDFNDPTVCSGKGSCVSNNNCECLTGYTGSQCQNVMKCYTIPFNDPSVCSGKGQCIASNNCSCIQGFSGTKCQNDDSIFTCFGFNSTNPLVCSGNGNCTSNGNCTCKEGFSGTKCQNDDSYFTCYDIDPSNTTYVCNGNGNCTAQNNCTCKEGYSGTRCQNAMQCYGIDFTNTTYVCNGNGNCTAANNCTCKDGFSGTRCQTNNNLITCGGLLPIDPQVCSGNGNCTAKNNCDCLYGYVGNQCADLLQCFTINYSESSVCSGNGICIEKNNCSCFDGYTGNKCQTSILHTCYGLNETDPLICSGNGQCVQNNNCSCIYGYSGNQCQKVLKCHTITFNDPLVCSGNGNCSLDGNCTCKQGFSGNKCQNDDSVFSCYGFNSTDPLVCSGNGNCTADNQCNCTDGFSGNKCQNNDNLFTCNGIDSNNATVCSGNGICISQNNCSCFSGFSGNRCQKDDNFFTCFGIDLSNSTVCNGNGICVSQNNCTCFSGYSGNKCQNNDMIIRCYGIESTDSSVCSGRGNCTFDNTCKCKDGFSGSQCQNDDNILKCYGVEFNSPFVCSGNGNCSSFGNCSCFEGFSGKKCEFDLNSNETASSNYTCYGINGGLSTVCSGNGNCIADNVCECFYGFDGSQCQKTLQCYGIDYNNPSVCSGNGICNSRNSCSCYENYVDTKCQTYRDPNATSFKCYGVQSNDSSVCSGRGNCTADNFCECQTGFKGSKCQNLVNYCFGIDEYSNNVCSGNGKCTSQDTCECSSNYFGNDCGVYILPETSTIKILSKYLYLIDSATENNVITVRSQRLVNNYKGMESRLKSVLILSTELVNYEFSQIGLFDKLQLFSNMTVGEYTANLTIVDTGYNIVVGQSIVKSLFNVMTLQQLSQPEILSKLTPKEINQITRELKRISNDQQVVSNIVSNFKDNVNNYTLDDGLDLTSSLLDLSITKLESKEKITISETLTSFTQNLIESSSNFTSEQVTPIAINIVSVASNILDNSGDNSAGKSQIIGKSIESIEKTISLISVVNSTENLLITTSKIMVLLISKAEYKNSHVIDKDYSLSLPELDFGFSFGLVKYENYLTDDLQNTTAISDILQVRPLSNGVFTPLRNLLTPFNLTFSIKKYETPNNETIATVVCKYWNETRSEWLKDGCVTTILSETQVMCSCYHTTKFSSFVDYSNIDFTTRTAQSSLAVANIIFSSIFIVIIIVILILLVVFRKSQPVKSRHVTPYLALTSLLIENLVSGIISKGLLLDKYNFNITIMTSVCAVISTALLTSAVWCYFVMSVRFIIHRYFYEYMMRIVENRQQKNNLLIKILNIFKQDKVLILSSVMLAVGFILYFAIFVILRGVSVFSDSQFTYSTTISLFIFLLSMTAMIFGIYILDFYLDCTNKQLRDELVDISDEIMLVESGDSHLSNLNSRKSLKITKPFIELLEQSQVKKIVSLFYSNDKLMFRPEAVFFMTGMLFFTVSYCLGFASVNDRYLINPSAAITQHVDVLDAISFLFDILMTICFIISFGGFSVCWAIVIESRKKNCFVESKQVVIKERIKSQRLENLADMTDKFDIYKLMKNKYLLRLFRQYSKLEMSLENYVIWMRIEHAKSKFAKLWIEMEGEPESIEEWNLLLQELEEWLTEHISSEAELSLNVSARSKKQFVTAVRVLETKVASIPSKNRDSLLNLKQTVRDAIESLTTDVLYNLMDTYSRFIITNEYKAMKEVEAVTEMTTFK
ncbi:predicted protein [Naegleria gruberi]|uniref:Predicted protein n=1 Tax=Naegleria gruberi TaxID=5762 RepID=D2V6T6_NAEGR|nr:uncharacterized protein NAEGRDRAFT_64551 [Naegleria gruberi]EFC47500.1 predicted protein [Naegleria gruberi]|eukprot:XP_002680244.1 predicted protein [Naegleria gruberi strain NEG-M]